MTLDRARALPPGLLSERVDGEWSAGREPYRFAQPSARLLRLARAGHRRLERADVHGHVHLGCGADAGVRLLRRQGGLGRLEAGQPGRIRLPADVVQDAAGRVSSFAAFHPGRAGAHNRCDRCAVRPERFRSVASPIGFRPGSSRRRPVKCPEGLRQRAEEREVRRAGRRCGRCRRRAPMPPRWEGRSTCCHRPGRTGRARRRRGPRQP